MSISRYEPEQTTADITLEAIDALESMIPHISMEPAQAYCDDVVQALAVLSIYDQIAFSRMKAKIKNACKGKASIKELEMNVRTATGRLRKERQSQWSEEAKSETLFPEIGFEIQLPP